jgi:hypothetical protein
MIRFFLVVAFVLGESEHADRFPFLPETLRGVAKKVAKGTARRSATWHRWVGAL